MAPEQYPYPQPPPPPWPYDWYQRYGRMRAWWRRPFWGRNRYYGGWSRPWAGGWSRRLTGGWSRPWAGSLSRPWAGSLSRPFIRTRGPLISVRGGAVVRDHRRR
jgi:hypothetical protein